MNKRLLVVFSVVFNVALTTLAGQMTAQAGPYLGEEQCRDIVTKALDKLQNACTKLDRNSACYGNDQINVEFANTTDLAFQQRGDKVPVGVIKSLITFPMDPETGAWGLSVLKLQASLPDTMPGQNITFIVSGDTSVQNTSGDMRVFYFSSGLGQPACTAVPPEGILVQSPNHMQVSFMANGVQINIASTVFLRASPNKSMEIALLEGHTTVSTKMGSKTLLPGQYVSVALGGTSGLEPTGAPGLPLRIDAQMQNSLSSLIKSARIISGDANILMPAYTIPLTTPIKSDAGTPPPSAVTPQKAKGGKESGKEKSQIGWSSDSSGQSGSGKQKR